MNIYIANISAAIAYGTAWYVALICKLFVSASHSCLQVRLVCKEHVGTPTRQSTTAVDGLLACSPWFILGLPCSGYLDGQGEDW